MAKLSSPIPTPKNSRVKRVHHHVRRHYYAYMPDKKHHRILIWVVFLFLSLVIALQLLYPPDKALPFARIQATAVGGQAHDELAGRIEAAFRTTKIKLTTNEGAHAETMLSDAGAEPSTEAMISSLMDYPFWVRFVPFSILIQRPALEYSNHSFSSIVLDEYASEQATKLSTRPSDARLTIKDGVLQAEVEKNGSTVAMRDITRKVNETPIVLGATTNVTIPTKIITPKRTAADFASVKQLAEAALDREVLITAKDKSFSPTRTTVASWLVITETKSGEPTLTIDTKAFGKYINIINKAVGTAAGTTDIKLVDGREVSRNVGKTGDKVERVSLERSVQAWLLNGEGQAEIAASFVDVAPSVIYNSRYTSSQKGLQAYLNDTSKRMDVHIAITQLNGTKWTASTRANDSIPSASTFKLYISKWLFDEIDKGTVKWNDPILDTNVSTCFDRMTIASTNPCAYEWLSRVGRSKMNSYVYGLGFSRGTTFTAPDATHSTANDLLKMMIGIEKGTIMQGSNRDKLIHNLTIHPYRYGVPTGSSGRVYDKVGFLWDYVHDAAIVHHPKGTYAVVIMTKGQSYQTIANITREIEKIMYP